MADDLKLVRDLFKKAEVSLGANDVWAVQGTPVVKHKALERLAAALRIRFEVPTILRAEKDEAVILVTGEIAPPPGVANGNFVNPREWSIGEALVNVNYRVTGKMAAYVYAMAEKRAKDRVILKLAGLQGVYSEEEADDFKQVNASRNEDASDILLSAESMLNAAALGGTGTLKAAWMRLDADVRQAMGGKAPERFKQLAAQHDQKDAA